MENFSNSVIIPDDLPEIKQETFNALEKNYLKILLVRTFIFSLFLIGGFVAFLLISEGEIPGFVLGIIISVISILIVYTLTITILGFPRKGYLVRENDVSFKKGLIAYKQTSVPFNRIQHVEVNQGILGKIFKLSSVKIYTAGGTSSDLSIPGLPVETAHKLKAFLSEKIKEHE
jgi:membrane protein YdbS with pleckstrin-like domain